MQTKGNVADGISLHNRDQIMEWYRENTANRGAHLEPLDDFEFWKQIHILRVGYGDVWETMRLESAWWLGRHGVDVTLDIVPAPRFPFHIR